MEDIINEVEGKIQVIFEKSDGGRTYRDALWFEKDEYDVLTHEQILTMQQERFDNWLAVVNALPTENIVEEPTPI